MTTHEFVQVCTCFIGPPESRCPIHDPRPATTTTAVCTRCLDLERLLHDWSDDWMADECDVRPDGQCPPHDWLGKGECIQARTRRALKGAVHGSE